MKARFLGIVIVTVAATGVFVASQAHAQLQGEPTPEAAEVTVTLASLSGPFQMEVLEEPPAEPELGAGEVVITYWGDGDAIALLQEIAWTLDIDDPAHTSLPLGIAPLSDQTVPTMSLDAIAVFATSNGATVLFGDVDGLIGIRTAGNVSSIIPNQVVEFQLAVAGELATGCTAKAGTCECDADGANASCSAWRAGGTDYARCNDGAHVTTCEAQSNSCSCSTTPAQ